jgi:hypothetical protein
MQALLGYACGWCWICHAHAHLRHLFGYLPGEPGYNRRLRAAAGLITTLTRLLAACHHCPLGIGSLGPGWGARRPAVRGNQQADPESAPGATAIGIMTRTRRTKAGRVFQQ